MTIKEKKKKRSNSQREYWRRPSFVLIMQMYADASLQNSFPSLIFYAYLSEYEYSYGYKY